LQAMINQNMEGNLKFPMACFFMSTKGTINHLKIYIMEKQSKAKKSAPASKSGSTATKSKSAPKKSATPAVTGGQDSSMLQEFILDSLKDIYWAEKHLTKALPKLQKAATSEELKQAFQEHTTVTQEQVARLEEVFGILGKKPQAKKCEAMEGLTKEAETVIGDTEKGSKTRDVALIMAAQKVEHYEIATYGSLVQITKTMGMTEIADILAETLAEEKETDELLTGIAENNINMQAEQEEGGGAEGAED
jgi:ferritin-like metal-binding protein YciE